jgi:hypothetical protein
MKIMRLRLVALEFLEIHLRRHINRDRYSVALNFYMLDGKAGSKIKQTV